MTYNVGQLLEYQDRRGAWHFVMVTSIDWPRFAYRNLDMCAGGQTDHADASFRPVTEERLIALTEEKRPMVSATLTVARSDRQATEGSKPIPEGSHSGGTDA